MHCLRDKNHCGDRLGSTMGLPDLRELKGQAAGEEGIPPQSSEQR